MVVQGCVPVVLNRNAGNAHGTKFNTDNLEAQRKHERTQKWSN